MSFFDVREIYSFSEKSFFALNLPGFKNLAGFAIVGVQNLFWGIRIPANGFSHCLKTIGG